MSWFSDFFKNTKSGFFDLEQGCYNLDYNADILPQLELAYKRNSPIISSITNRHNKDVAETEFGKETDDGITPVQEIPEYSRLKLDEMAGDFASDLDIDGNIYLEKIGNNTYRRIKPVNVTWEGTDILQIDRGFGKITIYNYDKFNDYFTTNQNGQEAILYHKRLYDNINNETGRGESPLLPIQNQILMTIYADVHNSTYLKKGMKSDMLIMVENSMTKENFESFKQDFIKKYSGGNNAGTPIVMSGVKGNVENMQGKSRDMDFKNLQDNSKINIATVYNIPLPIVTTESQTFNNYATAEVNYYKNSVLPLMNFIVKFFNTIFEDDFVINESSIPALKKEMISNSFDMSKAGCYSVNECREIAGYPEIIGGEQIFRPSSEIPIGVDGGMDDE